MCMEVSALRKQFNVGASYIKVLYMMFSRVISNLKKVTLINNL